MAFADDARKRIVDMDEVATLFNTLDSNISTNATNIASNVTDINNAKTRLFSDSHSSKVSISSTTEADIHNITVTGVDTGDIIEVRTIINVQGSDSGDNWWLKVVIDGTDQGFSHYTEGIKTGTDGDVYPWVCYARHVVSGSSNVTVATRWRAASSPTGSLSSANGDTYVYVSKGS